MRVERGVENTVQPLQNISRSKYLMATYFEWPHIFMSLDPKLLLSKQKLGYIKSRVPNSHVTMPFRQKVCLKKLEEYFAKPALVSN